jgi:BirA family transcriptional regulator, biotin operon repressor / biotin---[acetyl-CoA-carboxylase] ligase
VSDWRLRNYETLESTSDLCVTLARAGEPDGLAVLARRQTKGRGSRGRNWESPAGNLYLSVLLRPAGNAVEAGRWALLAGVALAEALEHRLRDPSTIRLKWPNDVLLAGRKLAGILIDSEIDAEGRLEWLVIGLGANLVQAPAIAGRSVAALAEAGVASAPEAVAARVLERLRHWQHARHVQGFEAVRTAWLQRAHPVGTQLTVRFAGQVLSGSFVGLDEDGSLLLQGTSGVRRLPTAEILTAREG